VSCQELVELVTAYLEGSLSDPDRAAFEAHLALCPGCETYLDQYRRTIGLLGGLTEESLSAPARDRLLAAFRGWRTSSGSGTEVP
jgi:anti-sigma factor RsiW